MARINYRTAEESNDCWFCWSEVYFAFFSITCWVLFCESYSKYIFQWNNLVFVRQYWRFRSYSCMLFRIWFLFNWCLISFHSEIILIVFWFLFSLLQKSGYEVYLLEAPYKDPTVITAVLSIISPLTVKYVFRCLVTTYFVMLGALDEPSMSHFPFLT